jgi:hypothetical protein
MTNVRYISSRLDSKDLHESEEVRRKRRKIQKKCAVYTFEEFERECGACRADLKTA